MSAEQVARPSVAARVGQSTNVECRLLEARDVADLLGVTTKWVYAETRAGRIPHVRLGPRYVRYRASSIASWLAGEERGPGSRPESFRDG
jgi:excisionase family DNA binding protein